MTLIRFNLWHLWLRWLVYRLPRPLVRWLVSRAAASWRGQGAPGVAELLNQIQNQGRWLQVFAVLRLANHACGAPYPEHFWHELAVADILKRWDYFQEG